MRTEAGAEDDAGGAAGAGRAVLAPPTPERLRARLDPRAPYRLHRARVPVALLPRSLATATKLEDGGRDGAPPLPRAPGHALVDVLVAEGRIAAVTARGACADAPHPHAPAHDLRGAILLPALTDVHTHLDKGGIAPRAPNADHSFAGALAAVGADRAARWAADDVRARAEFALACAHAHGTRAIRTHLDSTGPQTAISWPLFDELRAEWRGRIELQMSAIFAIDVVRLNPSEFREVVRTVARHGGALGGVTHLGEVPAEETRARLKILFEAAAAHGLDLDLHVDESGEPHARTLEIVADVALETRFPGRVLAGHCCSLSLMDEAEFARVAAKLGEARIAVVSLPMCNLYLQDRARGATPRWRGVAPLRELAAAGVDVMVASDNTRDPFYAYGDLDGLELAREATRILHLDADETGDTPLWPMLTTTPAALARFAPSGRIEPGEAADLVVTRARTATELFARPQSDRLVIRNGAPLDARPPHFAELDALMEPA